MEQVTALVDGERDFIANAANAAAVVYFGLEEINWAGFYILRDGELVLGPFCGRPACVRKALGRGVCGMAAERKETLVVDDVHAFDGHIAGDPASASEIVVPLVRDGRLIAVLDVDSPRLERFGVAERNVLEQIAAIVATKSGTPG